MSRTKTKTVSHLNIDSNGKMTWDWNTLLEEVRQATGPFKPTKNLIDETETKLKTTRKKK